MSIQQFLLGESMRTMALAEGALGKRYVVQQLADAALNATSVPSQDFPDIDAEDNSVFTHWCDPERAVECLAESMKDREQDIDRMTPAEQVVAVMRSWRYFSLFFAYMNLSIYGWDKLRRVFQQALGSTHRVSYDGDTPDARMSLYRWGEQRLNGQMWAMWRAKLVSAYMNNPGKLDPGRQVDTATFGGIGNGNVDQIGQEMFSLWFAANDMLAGNQLMTKDNYRALFPVFSPDIGRTKQTLCWRWGSKINEGHGAWECDPFDWRTSASRENYVGQLDQIHLTMQAPLHWYWSLLFGKVPGLRKGCTAGDLFPDGAIPEYQGPGGSRDKSEDISIAEYIMQMGPANMVIEIRRDVITNNTPVINEMTRRINVEGHLSADPQYEAELSRVSRQRQQASQLANVGMGLGLALIAIPTPVTIVAGAVIGLGSFVAGVIYNSELKPGRNMIFDVYKRPLAYGLERYLEFFRIADPATGPGLTSFLAYWKDLSDQYSDVLRSRRSLNQILREDAYVRSVLGFPGWLDASIYEGVPGYVPPPPPPPPPIKKWPAKRIAKVVAISSTALLVVGVTAIAIWKPEEAKEVAATGWRGVTNTASTIGQGAKNAWGRVTGQHPQALPAYGVQG